MKKSKLSLIIALGLVPTLISDVQAALNWQQVNEIPAAVTIRLYVQNDTLYSSTGGLIYRLDPQAGTWDTLATLDTAVQYIAAIIKAGPRLFAGTYNLGVFESDDNGGSWMSLNAGLSGLGANSIVDFAGRGLSLFVGTSGSGIFVMNLSGPSVWTNYNEGMPDILAADVLSLYNHDTVLLSGAGLNTTLYRNAPDTSAWTEIPFAVFDPRGVGMLDMTSLDGLVYGAASNGLYVSRDSGVTWERDAVTPHLISSGSVAADSNGVYASTFFAVYGGYYYAYTGSSWQVIDSVPGILPYDLAVLDGRLYSARQDGLWYAELNPTAANLDTPSLPTHFQLEQNYPNPFNPTTRIEFEIEERSMVTLEICNMLGQHVSTLMHSTLSAGPHVVSWNGRDDSGLPMSSGVYLYRLSAGSRTNCRRMLLLK